MKRIILFIMTVFIIGCGRSENETVQTPIDGTITPSAEQIDSDNEKVSPNQSEKATNNSILYDEPSAGYLFTQDDVVPYDRNVTQTIIEMTIYDSSKTKDGILFSFHNQTVDFQDMRIEVLSFDPASDNEACKLRLSFPASWDEALCYNMISRLLHFRFEIDDHPIDIFRDRVIMQSSSHTYELIYRHCLLKQLYGRKLAIRPYTVKTEQLTIWDNEEKNVNLTETREISVLANNIYGINNVRQYIDKSAVIICIDQPEHKISSILYPITIEDVDWEASFQKGCYGNGETPSETCDLFLIEKDFNGASLTLDSLHIQDDLMIMEYTWRFPDTFSDVECQSIWRDSLCFYAFFDNDSITNQHDIRSKEHAPFGRTRTLIPFCEPYERPSYTNYQTNDYRELHFMIIGSAESVEQWKTHRTLSIVPYYWFYTDITYNRRNVELTEEGIHLDRNWMINELSFKAINELTITIDLTSELFENGF